MGREAAAGRGVPVETAYQNQAADGTGFLRPGESACASLIIFMGGLILLIRGPGMNFRIDTPPAACKDGPAARLRALTATIGSNAMHEHRFNYFAFTFRFSFGEGGPRRRRARVG